MDFEQYKDGKIKFKKITKVYLIGITLGYLLPHKYFTQIMKSYYDYLSKNTFCYSRNKYYCSMK